MNPFTKNENVMNGLRITRILVSAACLAVLFYFIDWREGVEVLGRIRPVWILVGLLMYPLALLVASFRWSRLLRPHGINCPVQRLVGFYWVGAFFNNLMPSNIGGDLMRISFFPKRMAQLVGSVVVERFCGFSALVLFVSFALLFSNVLHFQGGRFAGLLGIITVPLVFVVLWRLRWPARVNGAVGWRGIFLGRLAKLYVALSVYRRLPSTIFAVVVISLLYHFMAFLFHFFIAKSLGLEISLVQILQLSPIVFLVSMLPISLNAIGVAESAFVLLYSRIGLPHSEALVFAVVVRLFQILCSSAGGLLWPLLCQYRDEKEVV